MDSSTPTAGEIFWNNNKTAGLGNPSNKNKAAAQIVCKSWNQATLFPGAVRPKRYQSGHRSILEATQVHPFVIFSFLF